MRSVFAYVYACVRIRMRTSKKVKVQVYNLISNISSDFYIFTPWSLHLFINLPSQLHGPFIHVPFQLSGEHKILQPFRRTELIVHIAISVLPGTHFYQVKHLRVKCLVQGHNIETLSQDWEGRNMIFLWKPEPSGIQNRTADSDTGRAPRCNHCAMSLSNNASVRLQISDSRHPCFSVIIYQPSLLLFPYV